MLPPFTTRLAIARSQLGLEAKAGQSIDVVICYENDITAFATITTVRTAFINIFFVAKANRTSPALTGHDHHLCRICKHTSILPPPWLLPMLIDLSSNPKVDAHG